MDYNNLLFEKRNEIGYLTLNRPEKLNALSPALMAEFRHALDTIEEDAEIKVVILTGAGRAFSAGLTSALHKASRRFMNANPTNGVRPSSKISIPSSKSGIRANRTSRLSMAMR